MILEAQHLEKSFIQGDRKIPVLKDLNLAVKAGESLAILGKSGSGKTTLLTLIAGLDRPDKGRVILNGRDLGQLSEDELSEIRRQEMTIVFQQFHLFRHLTALENVLLPLELSNRTEEKDEALRLLKRVGLENRIHHYPTQLSGGECQRLAIARALVVKPQILLADEPSGNLDQTTGDQVMDLMFDLVKEKGLTLILVTHNPELATRCHRQLTIQG